MKLELILRLLDNDELSPEQVNDVKDFLEDYAERNQVLLLENSPFPYPVQSLSWGYCVNYIFVLNHIFCLELFLCSLLVIFLPFSLATICFFIFLQEDFDDFSDVDELYSSLPLDESLEDLVTIGPLSKVTCFILPVSFLLNLIVACG